MRNTYFLLSIIIISLLIGCDSKENPNQNVVPVDFRELIGDPSTVELKKAEKCLSKFASKLEKDLIRGMESSGYKTDIFSISAHKIFTDSQNNINVQYSISGMQVLPSGNELMMDNKKEMINCVSQT